MHSIKMEYVSDVFNIGLPMIIIWLFHHSDNPDHGPRRAHSLRENMTKDKGRHTINTQAVD